MREKNSILLVATWPKMNFYEKISTETVSVFVGFFRVSLKFSKFNLLLFLLVRVQYNENKKHFQSVEVEKSARAHPKMR